MQALIIDGNETKILEMNESETLEALQGAVGGLIQYLPFPVEGVDAFVNDEGKYATWINEAGDIVEGLPVNETATAIMRNAGLLFPGDWISGPMVLSACDGEGETVSLTEEQHEAIRQLI